MSTKSPRDIPIPGTAADRLEDRALQQEMRWILLRDGWSARSEARRQWYKGKSMKRRRKKFRAKVYSPRRS